MARPERRDVDYFPFYAKEGKTLFILESEYGCKGTGFFTNVMRFLAGEKDHHYCIRDEGDQLYFFTKCHCDEESGLDMISIMVKTGKLDRDLWEQAKILASQDFIDSIQDAYKRRNNDCITISKLKERYKVTVSINTQGCEFPATETPPIGTIEGEDGQTDSKNPQTKLKKTKLKEPAIADFFKNPFHPYFKSIETSCITLSKIPSPSKKPFNPFQFVNRKINKKNMHPGAIDYALKGLLKRILSSEQYEDKIDSFYGYAKSILKTANGNFCEKEHIEDHEQMKKDFAEFVANSTSLKAMLKGVGKKI